jgi:hypothetical protein
MNVARQFTAWKVRLEDPPRRVRCDGLPPAAPRSGVQVRFLLRTRRLCVRRVKFQSPTTPHPAGRNHCCGSPGNKLPGYLHSVPTGQSPTTSKGCSKKANVRQLESIAGHYIQLKKSDRNHFGRGSDKTWTPVCRLFGWTW